MTYPPKRILVPVDFGDASARAVAAAAALAREYGAELDALHVEALDAPPYFTHDQVKALEAQRSNARLAARRYLTSFLQKHGAPRASAIIEDGAPADVILRHAVGVDAIVMGTNDRSIAARLWMGSVAERVHRDSPVPVLVIRASEETDAAQLATRLRQEAASRALHQEEKR